MNFLEPNDDELLFIPANPPVRPFRYDPRGEEQSLFPQSELEKRYARHLRTQSHYDLASQSLVVRCHRNPVVWGDLKHALAHYREEEGRVVRRIVLYMDPEIFRDQFLELKYRKFEREEGPLERAANGHFVVVKTLKVKEGAEEVPTEQRYLEQ